MMTPSPTPADPRVEALMLLVENFAELYSNSTGYFCGAARVKLRRALTATLAEMQSRIDKLNANLIAADSAALAATPLEPVATIYSPDFIAGIARGRELEKREPLVILAGDEITAEKIKAFALKNGFSEDNPRSIQAEAEDLTRQIHKLFKRGEATEDHGLIGNLRCILDHAIPDPAAPQVPEADLLNAAKQLVAAHDMAAGPRKIIRVTRCLEALRAAMAAAMVKEIK